MINKFSSYIMLEILSKLESIYDIVDNIKSFYINELIKKERIIKQQQKYIKQLEDFIEEFK
jgi:hypothetical protein